MKTEIYDSFVIGCTLLAFAVHSFYFSLCIAAVVIATRFVEWQTATPEEKILLEKRLNSWHLALLVLIIAAIIMIPFLF